MKKMTTKDRILYEALTLFSRKGYDAVSVEEIAAAVGIKAPSLYKHFKGKRDIFDSIIAMMRSKYYEQTSGMALHLSDFSLDVSLFSQISEDGLVEKMLEFVNYYLHDDYLSKFRRMTVLEQYKNKDFAALYSRYADKVMSYHTELFARMMENGVLKKADSAVVALQYVAPIRFLIARCDREPEKEAEILQTAAAHIRQFYRIWGNAKKLQ